MRYLAFLVFLAQIVVDIDADVQYLIVEGKVLDQSEAAIPDVQVRIFRQGRIIEKVKTGSDGSYSIKIERGANLEEIIYWAAGWLPGRVGSLSGAENQMINKVLYRPESAPANLDHLTVLESFRRLSDIQLAANERQGLQSTLSRFLVPVKYSDLASEVLEEISAVGSPSVVDIDQGSSEEEELPMFEIFKKPEPIRQSYRISGSSFHDPLWANQISIESSSDDTARWASWLGAMVAPEDESLTVGLSTLLRSGWRGYDLRNLEDVGGAWDFVSPYCRKPFGAVGIGGCVEILPGEVSGEGDDLFAPSLFSFRAGSFPEIKDRLCGKWLLDEVDFSPCTSLDESGSVCIVPTPRFKITPR